MNNTFHQKTINSEKELDGKKATAFGIAGEDSNFIIFEVENYSEENEFLTKLTDEINQRHRNSLTKLSSLTLDSPGNINSGVSNGNPFYNKNVTILIIILLLCFKIRCQIVKVNLIWE